VFIATWRQLLDIHSVCPLDFCCCHATMMLDNRLNTCSTLANNGSTTYNVSDEPTRRQRNPHVAAGLNDKPDVLIRVTMVAMMTMPTTVIHDLCVSHLMEQVCLRGLTAPTPTNDRITDKRRLKIITPLSSLWLFRLLCTLTHAPAASHRSATEFTRA
jgi:hypothetical protein